MANASNQIRSLNIRLRNSFASIKQDMQDLKQSQMANLSSSKQMTKRLEDMKEGFVTKDKFNVLKIKIGDLNEDMKKLGKVEKDLDNLKETSAKKETTEKNLSEMKKEIKDMDKEVQKSVSEKQMKKLIEEVNSEFDLMKEDVSKLEGKGGKAAELMIERHKEQMQVMIDELKAKIQGLKQITGNQVKRAAVESLVNDINVEFDDLKDNIDVVESDIKHMASEIKKLQKEAAMKKQMEDKMKELRVEMGNLKADLGEEFAKTRKTIKKLDVRNLGGDTKSKEQIKKELMKTYKIKAAKPEKKAKKKGKGLFITANILIGLAFGALGGSIITYVLDKILWMNGFIIAAITLFVIGVVLRVIAIMRETRN